MDVYVTRESSEKRLSEVRNRSPYLTWKEGVGGVAGSWGDTIVFKGNGEGISGRQQSLKVGLKKIDGQ